MDISRPNLVYKTTRTYDVAIIGGGITGVGSAADAAIRGMDVILFEAGDYACGTSSKTTKMIHGGIRYLAEGQVLVTREAIRERCLLRKKLAPSLVYDLPIVVPNYQNNRQRARTFAFGMRVYDWLAGRKNTHKHRLAPISEVQALFPGILNDGLLGGSVMYDCRTDDARFVLSVLQLARDHGAVVSNYAPVERIVKTSGGLYELTVADALNPRTPAVTIRARTVLSATGVWTEETASLAGESSPLKIKPAKGVHLIFRSKRLPIESGLVVYSAANDGRFLFAYPWYGGTLVGTTDTAYSGDLRNVPVLADERAYIIDSLNALFPDAHLTTADIAGEIAGLRPLVSEQAARGKTTAVSRKHSLKETASGVILVAGGKLTTYRRMAKESIDHVAWRLRKEHGRKFTRCQTHKHMIGGWHQQDCDIDRIMRRIAGDLVAYGLSKETAQYLTTVYGGRIGPLTSLVHRRRELGALLADGHPYIEAQVVQAVEREAAFTIEDVLARRIRLSVVDSAGAVRAADRVSQLMAPLLGWSDTTRKENVDQFCANFSPEFSTAR